jgi:DNA-binding protein H-NS
VPNVVYSHYLTLQVDFQSLTAPVFAAMATMAPCHCLVYDRHQSLQPTICSLSAFYGIVQQLLSLSQEENMTTLEKVQARIKKLQGQADALIAKQSSAVLETIRGLMREHGLTSADIDAHIGGKKRGPNARAKAAVKAASTTAKYRDPKSGATWSGRGRAPSWIASVKDRKKFLVDGSAASSATAPASKVKAAGKYVRGPQPAKYVNPKTGATWSGRGPAPAWLASVKDRSRFLIDTAGAVATDAGVASKAKPVAKKAAAKKAATKAVKATKVPTAKKTAAKKVVSATAAAPKSGAPKKVAGRTAAPTVKKAAAKKVPARNANVAKEVVERAEVGAAPTAVTAQPTA